MTVTEEALARVKKALEDGRGVRVAIDIDPEGECEIVIIEGAVRFVEASEPGTDVAPLWPEPLFQRRIPYADVAPMLPLMLSYLA